MTATVSNGSWYRDANPRRSALGRAKAALLQVESEAGSFFRLMLALLVSMLVHLGVLQWKDADYPVIEPAVDRDSIRIALPVVNQSGADNFSLHAARPASASKTRAPAPRHAVSPGSKRIPKPTRHRQPIPLKSGKAEKRQSTQATRKKSQSVRRSQPADAVAGAKQAKSPAATESAAFSTATRPKSTPMERQYRKSNAIARSEHGSPKAAAGSASSRSVTLLIRHPRFRRPPRPPVYPRQAIRRGQEGTATIRAKISSAGAVQQIRLFRSSGSSLLDHAATAAVRKWEFEPTTRKGEPVEAWVEVPVNFVLSQSSRGRP